MPAALPADEPARLRLLEQLRGYWTRPIDIGAVLSELQQVAAAAR